MSTATDLPDIPLPSAIRSRFVDGINGLRMHVLEAGFETKGRPCVLLLHGFPELAYLAQRDAGAGGSRLSRDRAGPVRLWPHHRLEIRLRSQSQSIPAAQSGARWCGRTYSDRSR
jgi:hypothetical protein